MVATLVTQLSLPLILLPSRNSSQERPLFKQSSKDSFLGLAEEHP